MQKTHESSVISFSSKESIDARMKIHELLENYPSTKEEKERSLGLFLRGSLLARVMATAEIYKQIIDIPGCIFDLGTWRGQTAVLCENFRAIFEPLHFNRRIMCFDTFEGYSGFSEKDNATMLHQNGTYAVGGKEYADFLRNLLQLHEQSNAMGHIHNKHQVIEGDVTETLPHFLAENKNELIALAFFDLNSYNPTTQSFNLIYERLVSGGIIAFWQLTRDSIPAEGTVYNEHILNKIPHTLHKSLLYPGLCYLKKQ